MTRVLVIHAGLMGHTAQMAERVADGAREAGAEAMVMPADAATAAQVRWADALAVGAAVHMGGPDWRARRFIEEAVGPLWLTDELVGKVGAVFTTGGGFGSNGAGCELTQLALLGALAESGMVLVPFPKCTPGAQVADAHWGPNGRTGGAYMEPGDLNPDALEAAHRHGGNLARVAAALAGRTDLFARGVSAPSGELLEHYKAGFSAARPEQPMPASGAD